LFAVYSATNSLRFNSVGSAHLNMNELLLQFVHQGAGQMASVQQTVRNYLANGRNVRPRL